MNQSVIHRAIERIRSTAHSVVGVDGIPTAAARALRMMMDSGRLTVGNHVRANTLAVHIGWKKTTLVLVSNDIPALARVPQIEGLEGWVRKAQHRSGLTAVDLLKITQGLHARLPVQVPPALLTGLMSTTEEWAASLCEEVLRSITFARRPGLRMMPGHIVLMGSGSIIPGLQQSLSEQLNIATCPWTLPQENGLDASSEMAIASSLSAWEIGL